MSGMLTLLVGTALALVALAYVLYPIFVSGDAGPAEQAARREPNEAERAVDALREVEFDRATGKLSADDYAALKSAYTMEAVEAMRASDAAGAPDETATAPDDVVEALIERYRGQVATCPSCGERPEPAAVFCSSCGRRLRA
jgi:hypothetical protein